MKQTTGNAFQGSFDPSIFDHPLAQNVEWSGLNRFALPFPGASLGTKEDGSMVFGPSITTYGIIGGIMLVQVLSAFMFFKVIGPPTLLHPSLSEALPFLLIPILLFQVASCHMMFGKSSFYFVKGVYRSGFKMTFGNSLIGKMPEIQLSDVTALQLIGRRTPSKGDKPISYELNLVLKDGNRAHVVNYRKLKGLQEDAMQVAEKLSVPLWDASANTTEKQKRRSKF